MAKDIRHFFWDSCVFYAYLKNESSAYDVPSIGRYIEEAKAGEIKLYTSTLVLAEVVPSAIVKPGIGSLQHFINDLRGAITLIDANPNIMHMAAVHKDLPYRKGPGRETSQQRTRSC